MRTIEKAKVTENINSGILNKDKAEQNRRAELSKLALEVLDYARNRLLVNLRFMDTALTFHERTEYRGSASTDGRSLYYDPEYVLRVYRESREDVVRLYLHSVLHCVFMHPFTGSIRDSRMWDIACDIAAEAVIDELNIGAAGMERTERHRKAVRHLRGEVRYLTAEKIYHWLNSGNVSAGMIDSLEREFRMDEHSRWHADESRDGSGESDWTEADISQMRFDPEDFWKSTAEKIEMELETFAKVRGSAAGTMIQNLRSVTRERYDYEQFLSKFAVCGEDMKVSDDEFDYIYYNYGLTHYRNMPLIEPLEYREDNRIKDFVIAIDTSGSVAGEEVQAFLQKTYDILSSRHSFQSSVNVHIIQCDAEVQSDFAVRNEADLEHYMDTMEIRGLGGTDFRPLFRYVDGMIRNGEFSDLRGLLYFTDGLGTFPEKGPSYRTAFVFVDDGYSKPEVPPWAMKVLLPPIYDKM